MVPSHSNSGPGFESMRIAAEDVALQLGWLRECPSHGQPFKAKAPPGELNRQVHASSSSCNDELMAFAMRIANGYAEHCPHCAFETSIPE